MPIHLSSSIVEQMNHWGQIGTPFLFIIDFECEQPLLFPLDAVPNTIRFDLPMFPRKGKPISPFTKAIDFAAQPISETTYTKAFEQVQYHLQHGDTYLLNLTMPTPINTNLDLETIFAYSDAPYRLLIENQMVCFSPEIFVRIENGTISSYPMKGTIDADIPNAANILLQDPKELAEHNTIVDLIRNDLSMVAKKVHVKRYRYLDQIETHKGKLLQMSSEISGTLKADYPSHIGTILSRLLPAGSISGAPKEKTVEIIQAAEKDKRGYYTGVFGVFDGKNMDSAVMIRFIEAKENTYLYRSGGGITAKSDCHKEYEELINKVYVPIGKHTH